MAEICKKRGVKFLINDDPTLSKKLNADGCHIGQKDMSITEARKIGHKKRLSMQLEFQETQ